MSRPTFLAPSDLSYMYDRCPRCFWLKLKGVKAPDDVLPGIFRDIDRAQKKGVSIESIRQLGIPAREFIAGDRVMSVPKQWGGSELVVSGYTDRRVWLDDGTIGIIDFKTSAPKPDKMARFWRSMNAYRYAIENSEAPQQVTLLALLVFSPKDFHLRKDHATEAFYKGQLQRVDIELDRPGFEKFLTTIGDMLACPDMPDSGSCDICRHCDEVVKLRMNTLLGKIADHPELGPDYAAAIAARVTL